MSRKLSIIVFLCVAVLLPSIATAQFFAKQKVVVWAVMDRNNDVKVADATKTQIRTSMVDAFVNSRNYEVFEANINDVKERVGSAMSPINIAKALKEMYGVDYVLFTSIKIMQHSSSYDNFQVHLSSDLFSAETQKSERMAYVDMKSDLREIPGACAKLLSDLLGEQLSVVSPQPQQPMHQMPQYQQPAYSQSVQPVGKMYKVGDRYEANGVQGVVFEVSSDGKHGKIMSFTQASNKLVWSSANTWCSNQGAGWRLPTKEELCLIYKSKTILNSTLASVNARLSDGYYWSLSEYNPSRAWLVHMNEDLTYNYDKSGYFYVRAVYAF